MKIFKNIFVVCLTVTLIFTLFVPVWATEDNSSASTEIPVASIEETEVETETETSTEEVSNVIKNVEFSPERVMDYSKMYHVATVTVNDCAKIKWYFLTETGEIYNFGSINEHHDHTYEIVWNSLDMNGKHPAGTWNNPVDLRLSLVIIATSITGIDEVYKVWFTYTWYDSENAQTSTSVATASSVTEPKQRSDVPHTGL